MCPNACQVSTVKLAISASPFKFRQVKFKQTGLENEKMCF